MTGRVDTHDPAEYLTQVSGEAEGLAPSSTPEAAELERTFGQRLATIGVVALAVVASAGLVALIEIQTDRRITLLSLPFAVLIGWLIGRLVARRTVVIALLAGLVSLVMALADDYVVAVRGIAKGYHLTVLSVFRNPRGVYKFEWDRIWKPSDFAIWAACAVVATVLCWPPWRSVVVPEGDNLEDPHLVKDGSQELASADKHIAAES